MSPLCLCFALATNTSAPLKVFFRFCLLQEEGIEKKFITSFRLSYSEEVLEYRRRKNKVLVTTSETERMMQSIIICHFVV